ncbi:putative sugar O-methyltransferase [Rhizorhapis suberifaciens]|uniref:Putative sugar O-methyltransferase n=1 Tax=Rhizorhapis suberifaciens TaxID=13656 RepID=A0A840HQV5_9SPHN|nr:putative sugar O-methyltransferase [Rhizorhapis suberifaciens]MBB4640091.1 putative sugar O-methyltransferase [Rhizorhapis suberifaciens]
MTNFSDLSKPAIHIVVDSNSQALPLPWLHKEDHLYPEMFTRYWQTYPHIARRALSDYGDVQTSVFGSRGGTIDFMISRRLEVMGWMDDDVLVINHGIVDCWPRNRGQKCPAPEFDRLLGEALQFARERRPDRLIILMGLALADERTHEKTPGLKAAISHYDSIIRSHADASGSEFLDVQALQVTSTETFLHPDAHHFSSHGHRLIGEELARIVRSKLGVSRKDRPTLRKRIQYFGVQHLSRVVERLSGKAILTPWRLLMPAVRKHTGKGEAMQVQDDIALLDMMLSEQKAAPSIYQWTNYWAKKCNMAVAYLREAGLKDFRRIRAPRKTPAATFAAFGAVDLMPPLASEAIMSVVQNRAVQSHARNVYELPASRVGNPEGFEHQGVFFTLSWLNYYLRYVYVSRFLDLSGKIVVEIGSGSAKQAHLLKMAHPDATILIFDIPPQIYVANQYLKSVLPGEVVPFEESRILTSFDQIQRGKIHIFGNWHIDILRGATFDLLWNAASFQEMEPDVVGHYIDAAAGAKDVYLMQAMGGQSVAAAPGQNGVIEATTLETYQSALSRYEMIDESTAHLAMPKLPKPWPYTETYWRGK